MHARLAILLPLAALLVACDKPQLDVHIPFAVEFSGQSIECGAMDKAVQLTDLRFYVSDVQLEDVNGNLHSLEPNLALIDLEDGSGSCSNGTPDTQNILQGAVANGEYQSLRFTLGVPFDLNHRDPLLAEVPLDDAAMHWHWRGGYKFLRAGVRSADDGFWMHLGSTGCQGTLQNITGCNAPNRVVVQINDFVPGRDTVIIDLAEIVAAAELDDGIATDCSSGPAELHCGYAFDALGLEHETGKVAGEQRAFFSRATQ